ncbi:hypothetical protein DXN04_06465 [Chitinophaga silvisoli]|uniref:Uncharacterized protein n=1 Tax=Chitinophaga silvisoli TaxID=2291814 RepID=A0A3E1P4J8_9BACT|nr:hypothetical protein DXN04_06465 [Chitinophaga silvisoli]
MDDINKRAFNFPYFWMKLLMAEMDWSVVVMFRKMQNRNPKDKIVEELTVPEKMMILKLTFLVLEVYQRYLLHYALDEMTKEKFLELFGRYDNERGGIVDELEKCSFTISNLEEKIDYVVNFSSQLAIVWHSSDTGMKEKIQKLVFPDGIVYGREKGQYRTEKVNFVFARIVRLQRDWTENEKGDSHFF